MKIKFFSSILLGIVLTLSVVSCTPQPEQPDQPSRPPRPTLTEKPPLVTKTPAAPPVRPTKTTANLPTSTQPQPTQGQPAGDNVIAGEAVAGINLEAGGGTYENAFVTDYGINLWLWARGSRMYSTSRRTSRQCLSLRSPTCSGTTSASVQRTTRSLWPTILPKAAGM